MGRSVKKIEIQGILSLEKTLDLKMFLDRSKGKTVKVRKII